MPPRIGTVIHVEAVKTSIIRDNGKIGFRFKVPTRMLLHATRFPHLRLSCYQVFAAQIHVTDSGRENQVRRFIVGNFHIRYGSHLAQGKRRSDGVLYRRVYGKADIRAKAQRF